MEERIEEPEIFYAKLRDSGDGNMREITVPKEVCEANKFEVGDMLKVFVRKIHKEE